MARISQYEQDGTLNKQDKVLGTDSATGATKNYTIDSILSFVNTENLVEIFDGAAYTFQSYVDPADDPEGVINLNAGGATATAFSAINRIYVSVKDGKGQSLVEYLENAQNDFIKISKTDNLNQFGIYEVDNIVTYGDGTYRRLDVTPRGTNGTLTVGEKYFVANYSALYDQDFSDDSVTEFQDVTSAGSGQIITDEERQQLQGLNTNALLHADVVNTLTSTATDLPLSAEQGRVLKGLINDINTLLDVQDPALDTLHEIVAYIQTNRSNLESLGISNITGLQAALNAKQNTESGKGLSANDFTDLLLQKLNGISAGAQVNVKPNWSAAAGTDAEILNKPSDLTNLGIHDVTELRDVTSTGSGAIITSAERTKLTGIDVNATTRVVTDGTDSITVPPQNAEQNVQANWDESDTNSDAFIHNKPSIVSPTRTITVQGTTDEIEVTPNTAQDLTADRTVTIGLPNNVTIGDNLTVTNKLDVDGEIEVEDYISFTATDPSVDGDLGTATTSTYSYNYEDATTQATNAAPVFRGGNSFPSTGSDLSGYTTTALYWRGSVNSSSGWANLGNDLNVPPFNSQTHTGWSTMTGSGTFSTTQYITIEFADGSYYMFGATGWSGTALNSDAYFQLVGSIVQGSGTYDGAQGFGLKESGSPGSSLTNGIYIATEDTHDTMHFRYHGHDLSIDYLTQNIPTGILDGGTLAKVDATTFSIAAGDGVINVLNKGAGSDPHPEIKKIKWDAQNVTHTEGDANNADQLNTWVYINSSGSVVQSTTVPGPSVWRDNIVLGAVIHSSDTIIFTKTFPRTSYSTGNTYAEFAEIFGPLKKSGHKLTVNTTNTLALDRAAGVSFSLGRNYVVDPENPSIVDDAASTPTFHRYSSTSTGFTKDDGTAGAGYASIDPSLYDNNGTLTGMQSSKFSVQRLFHFPNNTNTIVAYYGKNYYDSIDEAEANYLLEDFQEADNTATQAIYLGALIVKGDATDLSNSGQAKILTAGIFRSLAAVNLGGVAADAALNDLTDVSLTNVSNNQVLKYNSSNGRWENQAEGGSIDGTGVANKLAIWSDADSLTNDTNLHWNSTNNYLGVNVSNPQRPLHVNGTIRLTSGTYGDWDFDRYYGLACLIAPSATTAFHFGTSANPSVATLTPVHLGKLGVGTTSPAASIDAGDNTDAIIVPKGTDTDRSAITAESGMFRFNTTSNEFEGYDGTEWGAIGGASGGSGEIVKKTFNGGVSAYVLDDTIADIDNVQVFVDGVYQYPSNYTVSGSTVTFVAGSTPGSGTNNVHIVHNVTAPTLTEGAAMSTSANLVGDGNTTSFALGGSPRSSEHMMVFLNGVYQEKTTYTLSGSNINFNTAPPSGYTIEVKYITGTLDLTDVGQMTLDELTGNGGTTYTLSTTPQSENYTNVYIEGVYQEKGTYSVSGSNIVFSSNVPTGYSIEVSTMATVAASSVTPTTFETDTFTANGTDNNFTLVNGSPSSKALTMVFIQGVYQAKSKYNLVSGQIQFTGGTPAEDDVIEVISISAVNTAGSAVTSVNGEVGAVTVQSKHDVSVISTDTNAVANTVYVFTASLTLTLPASPSLGDSIKISNLSGVDTCVLGANNNKIMDAAEDLTLDTASASFELIWSGATKGWVIIGQ